VVAAARGVFFALALALALARSFGAMIEDIIVLYVGFLVVFVFSIFLFLGREAVGAVNDGVHSKEFEL